MSTLLFVMFKETVRRAPSFERQETEEQKAEEMNATANLQFNSVTDIETDHNQHFSYEEDDILYEDYSKLSEEFTIKSSDESIALDSKFSDFSTVSEPIVLENNYVGEIINGLHLYKYFMYKFEDFDIYVSNLKYDVKDRPFDDYYISQITLTTDRYETSRGIKVGMKYDDVIELYEEVDEVSFDSNLGLTFKDGGYEIIFVFSEANIIETIILSIPTT